MATTLIGNLSRSWRLLAIIAVGALARLGLVHAGAHAADLDILSRWFVWLASVPPERAYELAISYPPGFAIIDQAWAHIVGAGVDPQWAVKGPSLAADAALAALVYFVSGRSLWAIALVWLNPAVIFDSAFWGQNDSIPAAFALAALAARDTPLGWPAFAFGILVKPPCIVLAPLLVRWRRMSALGLVLAGALVWVIAGVFFPGHPERIISQAQGGANLYPYNSVNAFNLWAVWLPFYLPDAPFKTVGYILFGAVVLLSLLARNRYVAATIIMLGFFCVLTEVHERYLYFAVVLCAAAPGRFYRAMCCVLTATLFCNLQFVLPTTAFVFPPWLVHALSALNVLALAALAARCAVQAVNAAASPTLRALSQAKSLTFPDGARQT